MTRWWRAKTNDERFNENKTLKNHIILNEMKQKKCITKAKKKLIKIIYLN